MSGIVYQRWHQDVSNEVWLTIDTARFIDHDTLQDISPLTLPILEAQRFSFSTILRDCWDGEDIFSPCLNKSNENFLIAAARAGCKSICKKLLNRNPRKLTMLVIGIVPLPLLHTMENVI
jgi:hypothetical protein